MYLIVHLLPLLVFKRRKLINKFYLSLPSPIPEIKKLIFGFVKSLLFAGGYSMLVRRTICFLTRYYSYNYSNWPSIQSLPTSVEL